MASYKIFMKSGHPPTLLAAFLYFDFSFAIWVLNGAMGPFISEQFHLSPQQIGLMVSVPTLAGAFMRFPLGVISQYIGRKNAAWRCRPSSSRSCTASSSSRPSTTFSRWASFSALPAPALASPRGSGWFPQQYKGLAMGIAGAGNSGTAVASLFAPRLAMHFGWQHVYGFAAAMMCLPLAVMIFFAKEPPDHEHLTLKEHLSCLFEKDGWYFNLIYIITFGGFIGLATFLPSFYYAQFHMTKVQAGTYTVLATFTGSATRVVGGYFADRIGGITTLSVVFLVAIAGLFGLMAAPSLLATTLLFMLCFAALGAGNGATFQLVPLRWPLTTAVAGGMIGEIGALGGSVLPNVLSYSKQHTGSFRSGWIAYAALAFAILILMRIVARSWTKTWVGKGGRALVPASPLPASETILVTGDGATFAAD